MEIDSKIKQHWEGVYKSVPAKCIPWESWEPEESLVNLVERGLVKKGSKALDICCGFGTNSVYLAKQGFDVTGIDVSRTALERAKKRAREEDAKVRFVLGNAYDLKFPNASFDFVMDRGCFHHIPPEMRERYVKGVKRVLKPGGKTLLMCFSATNNWQQENVFSVGRIREYFSGEFKILSHKDTMHSTPQGERVWLLAVLLERL